mgnify:CR=1 FL=1
MEVSIWYIVSYDVLPDSINIINICVHYFFAASSRLRRSKASMKLPGVAL